MPINTGRPTGTPITGKFSSKQAWKSLGGLSFESIFGGLPSGICPNLFGRTKIFKTPATSTETNLGSRVSFLKDSLKLQVKGRLTIEKVLIPISIH